MEVGAQARGIVSLRDNSRCILTRAAGPANVKESRRTRKRPPAANLFGRSCREEAMIWHPRPIHILFQDQLTLHRREMAWNTISARSPFS
jgi:hypothetical protein